MALSDVCSAVSPRILTACAAAWIAAKGTLTTQVVGVFDFALNVAQPFECTLCVIVFIAASGMLSVKSAENGLRISSFDVLCATTCCPTF